MKTAPLIAILALAAFVAEPASAQLFKKAQEPKKEAAQSAPPPSAAQPAPAPQGPMSGAQQAPAQKPAGGVASNAAKAPTPAQREARDRGKKKGFYSKAMEKKKSANK